MVKSGLPSLLMETAVSAAVADGVIPTGGGVKNDEEGCLPSSGNNSNSKDGSAAVEGLSAVAAAQQQQQLPPSMSINLNQLLGNSLLNAPLVGAINPSLMAVAAAAAQLHPSEIVSAQEPKMILLRRGKWTAEEEAYANRLIQEFKAGLLPLTDGTTLRTFLSKLLNCDPMRISKKFVGSNCIGKQVFRRRGADVNKLTPDEIERTRYELSELEKKFLDRVAHSKSSNRGGGGDNSTSKSAAKAAATLDMSSSDGGGGGGGNNNKSAAAVGRALLQGNKAPQASMDGTGGLLAQLQAENPGMFDHSLQRSSFMSDASLGNMSANSITNLLLQAGISRNQISMLTNKGMSSSTSLANVLGKNGSFDQLMSLDFQSMQSLDNIANLIQGNAGRLPTAQMKNMEWGNQWGGGGNGAPAPGLSSFNGAGGGNNKRSIDNLVNALSGGMGNNNNNAANNSNNLANSTNFSNFIQATKQGSNNLAGGPTNDIAKYIQSLTQQQQNQQQVNNMNYSNILQNMASGNMNNVNQNKGGSDLLSMLNQSSQSMNNFPQPQQQQHFNPFTQQLGLNQNPMMQLLAQAGAVGGGGNNVANLLAQSVGFNGLGGGMNNNIPLGQFGQALGGHNFNNFGSNFVPGNQQNTVALIQQLIAAQQQRNVGGANNNQAGAPDVGVMKNQTEVPNVAQGDNNITSGTKRSMDDVNDGGDGDNGGPTKKQMTAL